MSILVKLPPTDRERLTLLDTLYSNMAIEELRSMAKQAQCATTLRGDQPALPVLCNMHVAIDMLEQELFRQRILIDNHERTVTELTNILTDYIHSTGDYVSPVVSRLHNLQCSC